MKKTGLIYKATNKLNGKCYIGKTEKTLKKRKLQHLRSVFQEEKRNYKFYSALRKYGPTGFSWCVLADNVAVEDLDWYETWFVITFDSKREGYNSTLGGLVEKNLNNSWFLKGRTPWNKGLTKETDFRVKKAAEALRKSRIKYAKTPSPKNKRLTYETLYDCIVVRKMSRKQAAKFIGTTERLVKKWKQVWKIRSPNDGRIKKGQRLSPKTEIKKGQRLSPRTEFKKKRRS